ncbi:MAG TPA: TetR/AcrR family transcriptional regulator [Mycobacteriales bacterium]|nr:TetR/AcrR family transcriptional regulator [Mycobacteriales bacterium]
MAAGQAAAAAVQEGPRSSKGARTRARLLEAAKEIFEENGFLNARISDIADRAGLSHGSFYHYFESKEQIFREVAAIVDEELGAPLGDVVLAPATGLSPHARLREGVRLHFEAYREQARIMGIIEQVSRYDEPVGEMMLGRHRQYSEQVADSIRELQRRGLADKELDPAVAAAGIGALTGRFAELWLVQGAIDCSMDVAVEQVTKLIVNALGIAD